MRKAVKASANISNLDEFSPGRNTPVPISPLDLYGIPLPGSKPGRVSSEEYARKRKIDAELAKPAKLPKIGSAQITTLGQVAPTTSIPLVAYEIRPDTIQKRIANELSAYSAYMVKEREYKQAVAQYNRDNFAPEVQVGGLARVEFDKQVNALRDAELKTMELFGFNNPSNPVAQEQYNKRKAELYGSHHAMATHQKEDNVLKAITEGMPDFVTEAVGHLIEKHHKGDTSTVSGGTFRSETHQSLGTEPKAPSLGTDPRASAGALIEEFAGIAGIPTRGRPALPPGETARDKREELIAILSDMGADTRQYKGQYISRMSAKQAQDAIDEIEGLQAQL